MRNVDPVLSNKLNSQYQTKFDNSDPKMEVIIARARASVSDSTYFTIEKIRQKEGLSDVAVGARRLRPYGPPDKLYCIHLDNGIARTMHREYPDKLKAGWKNDFDIGNAKGVAITFDGRWNLTPRKTWGLKTDLLPWLFWIDASDNLQCRLWSEGPVFQLAANVSKIDSIRGWVPAQAGHTDDQGIIVAYVKNDGKIYYRNYCLQDDGLTIWETEQEVVELGAGNTGIRLFRTNDFRVGFISSCPTQNKMVLTHRNWGGMSIPAESLRATILPEIEFIPIEFPEHDASTEYLQSTIYNIEMELCHFEVPNPAVVSATRSGSDTVILEFNQDILNYVESAEGFTLSSGGTDYVIDSVILGNSNKKIEISMTTDVDLTLDIDVSYNSSNAELRTYVTDYCQRFIDDFTITATGAPQDGYAAEYLEAEITSTATLTAITFTSTEQQKEYLEAEIITTITLWDVDDAPL